eukprot:7296393-Ditylum_brightwellii.AAC.1
MALDTNQVAAIAATAINTAGLGLAPSALFHSLSAGSVPTKYYSTQGRPPDSSRDQSPPADSQVSYYEFSP